MSEGLRKTTVRGASWTGLAQAAGYVVTLGSLGLATRYLETSAFGVEAAVLTVIGMGTILADLGTGRALVQRPDLRDAHLVAAFWIGLFSSSILALLVWQTAGFWERLFAVSGMAAVLPVFASGLVFTGLGAAPRAHMERVLRFGHLATIDVVGSFLAGVILVVFSARGMGLWSLAWAYAVRCGVQGMGPWLFCPVVPWNSFGFREVKDLVGFGGKWAGSHLVGFAQQNLDYFLVGRFLGSEALGYYWLAYRLIAFPQTRLMQVVSKVTFPAFSAIQADLPRMRRAYLDTVTYVALFVFPLMAGFALLARPGLLVLYAPDKLPASDILQLLAPSGAARALGATVGIIFLSLGRTGLAFIWTCAAACFMLVALWVGLSGGVVGVALAVSLSGVVLLVVSLGIVNRLISLSFPAYFERLWPIFGSCVAMIAAVGSARWLFGQAFSPLWEVLFFSGLGGLVYLASLRILAPAVYHEARLLLGRS